MSTQPYQPRIRREDQEENVKTFEEIYAESAKNATLTLGFAGKSGKLLVENAADAAESIVLDAATSTATLGGNTAGDGQIQVRNALGKNTVSVNASVKVDVKTLPGQPQGPQRDLGGVIVVRDSSGDAACTLEGTGSLFLGGENKSIVLEGPLGSSTFGNVGTNGFVLVKNSNGIETISLYGATGAMALRNNDHVTILLDGGNGALTVGGAGSNGEVVIKNSNDAETIKITGSNGDIQFLNADVAEEFEIRPDYLPDVSPGTVVVVDDSGQLRPCDEDYDGRVVGIVAGAGQYRPGIVLDRKGGRNRLPVAMIGKTYCWVDADSEPVRVGDLLTTSGTKGHAKRASDRPRAFGSVIGKALQTLTNGRALIPVLVKPQ
jgi:hypothetical protein